MTKSLLLILLFIQYINTLAQISPGELSKAHSQLEGLSNCTRCHELGEKVSDSKCLDCHKDLNLRIKLNLGYHSSKYVKGKSCRNCHGEHFGKDFRLIKFDEKSFDHSVTGYLLEGKHSQIKCNECHKSKNIVISALKNKKTTYLGLEGNCITCHADIHRNTLGSNCGACHNNSSFKPAALFNHDNAKFKLLGEHLKVECSKCHKIENKNGKDFQKFTGLNYSNCFPCHQDVHKGKLGSDCKKCHVVSGFQFVAKQLFDHNKTDYPLLGRHKSVNCDKCHKGNIAVKPAYSYCIDCHTDYHKGEFTINNNLRDCSDCHVVNGFTPSTFTIEMHNKSKFILDGSHGAVICRDCHFKENIWHFRISDLSCTGCHSNPHGKELTDKFMPGNKCSYCHNTVSWTEINFDHNKTKFELTGRHRKTACGLCHYKENETGNKVYIFISSENKCESCHKDVHFSQFAENNITSCEKCHTTDGWKNLMFDHQKTKFPLDGAHSKVECGKCHKEISVGENKYVKFKIDEFKCADCHS